MPRFQFRLERVLSVRRHEEERDRMLFAAAAQQKLKAQSALAEVKRRMHEALEAAAALTRGRPTIEDFVRSHEYRLALLRREDAATRALAEAVAFEERARVKLIEARKKKRVLERLRERRHEEWRKSEEDIMQNELDEAGLNVYIRSERRMIGSTAAGPENSARADAREASSVL